MTGFEARVLMVSKWWMRSLTLRGFVNRIFTRESDRLILSQIFRELSPRQSLPIYRGLALRRRELCDVLPAAFGILARARARAAAARQDTRLGEAASAQRVRRGAGGDCRRVR